MKVALYFIHIQVLLVYIWNASKADIGNFILTVAYLDMLKDTYAKAQLHGIEK